MRVAEDLLHIALAPRSGRVKELVDHIVELAVLDEVGLGNQGGDESVGIRVLLALEELDQHQEGINLVNLIARRVVHESCLAVPKDRQLIRARLGAMHLVP